MSILRIGISEIKTNKFKLEMSYSMGSHQENFTTPIEDTSLKQKTRRQFLKQRVLANGNSLQREFSKGIDNAT